MNPIYLALDFSDLGSAIAMAREVRDHVGGYKVGLELIWRAGPEAVEAVSELGLPVFVDAKLHDIPNTVQAAARSIGRLGARFVTVHAGGGEPMMKAAVAGLAETAPDGGVLAVTVLTSLDEREFSRVGFRGSIGDGVDSMVDLAVVSGAEGVVCAVSDLRSVKERAPGLLAVTPGIRMPDDSAHDQERFATPAAARSAGADILVVGRPITASSDPARAARLMTEGVLGVL